MDKIDMRKLTAEAAYEVKKQVIRQKETGLKDSAVEKLTGVGRSSVNRVWNAYKRSGLKGLKQNARGRKNGEKTLLNKEQQQEIRKIIIDKTPEQIKLGFMLWTRQAISELVMQKYGIELDLRCITNYLKSWGFTCQRPTKKAYIQDNVKVTRFIEEVYPAIAKRAKSENAEIYWGDETGIDNQEHYQRGFAPKGQPPVIDVVSKRERVNMISAITNKGSLKFMIYDEKMTQQRLIEFMERLITDSTKKVFFIVDNLKVHHGKIVKAWLAEHKNEIELFYIPPYSPELNPDEYLNHALKLHIHSGIAPKTKQDIRGKTHKFMHRLTYYADEVKTFFRHEKVRYVLCSI
jgi:transposase